MIRRRAGCRRLDAVKAEIDEIEVIDEHTSTTRTDVVIKKLGKQRTLRAMLSLDKSLHHPTPFFVEIAI